MAEILLALVGLAVVTVVTRSFFFISERDVPIPGWLQEGLRYAPLAALMAIVAPEVFMTQGALIDTWRDSRLFAAAAAVAYFLWRRDILGTILSGTVVLLALRLTLGW